MQGLWVLAVILKINSAGMALLPIEMHESQNLCAISKDQYTKKSKYIFTCFKIPVNV